MAARIGLTERGRYPPRDDARALAISTEPWRDPSRDAAIPLHSK